MIWFVAAILYASLLLYFAAAWFKKNDSCDETAINNPPYVTVVVALRNEQNQVAPLLDCLLSQTYTPLSLVFVDDHSSDNTWSLLQQAASQHPCLQVIKAEGQGKKAALRQGIEAAGDGLILCTDADCQMQAQWVEAMVKAYKSQAASLLIGPVFLHQAPLWQQMEFLSLSALTAASALQNKAVLCSGANLAFTRSLYMQYANRLESSVSSGDDMFLLSAVQANGGKVAYVKDFSALVTTSGVASPSKWVEQRARWIRKKNAYTQPILRYTGVVVLLMLFCLCLSPLVAPFNHHALQLWWVKMMVDAALMLPMSRFLGNYRCWWWFLPVSLLYPFAVLVCFIVAYTRPIIWKERPITY